MLDTKLNVKVVHGEAQEMSDADTHVMYTSHENSQYMEWCVEEDDTGNDVEYEAGYEAALLLYKMLDKRLIKFSTRNALKNCRKRERRLTRKMQRLLEQFDVEDDEEIQIDDEYHPEITDLAMAVAMLQIHYRHDVFALGLLEILKNITESDESEYPQLIEKGLILSKLFKDTLRAWSRIPVFDINSKETRENYQKEYAFHFNIVETLIDTANRVTSHPSAMEWAEKFKQLITAEDIKNMDSLDIENMDSLMDSLIAVCNLQHTTGALPWHTSRQ